jgi:predicted RNA methylase
MRNKLVILTIFLLGSLAGHSQTSSKPTSQDCIVPCESLKKALIMKEEYKLMGKQIEFARDSIKVYKELVQLQTNLVDNKNKEIEIYQTNLKSQKDIIVEKDKQISTYKSKLRKEKALKFVGFGMSTLSIAALVVILL